MSKTVHPVRELQQLREACPLLDSHIYLANCSQGPLSSSVRAALHHFEQGWATLGMNWDGWIAEVEQAREAFASLVGAQASEIVVGSSVSQLVSSLVSGLVTSSLFQRRRIVTSVAEFPGVAQAWLASSAYGAQVEVIAGCDEYDVTNDDLLHALDAKTLLVSLPHVCYANGRLLDPKAIVAAAHAQGILVCVDAYQSLGTVHIDVKESDVDFLVSGNLKYLLGTAGIAFMYVKPSLIAQLEPTVTGWFGRENPFAFNPSQLDYAASAARFDLGTPPIINAYAARAGMQLILRTGVDRIWQHVEHLSSLAYELAPRLGLRILGPQTSEQKGATTAIDAGSAERAHTLEAILRDQKVLVSARNRAIRLAPHGFTFEEEMEQALSITARLLHTV